MTHHDLQRLLRKKPGVKVVGAGKNSIAKPTPRPRPLAKTKAKDKDSGRFLVRICSVRSRLADPDGLVGKYHLDFLRYIGCIADDTAAVLDYEITQRKCEKGQEESTEIEVWRLNAYPADLSKEP